MKDFMNQPIEYEWTYRDIIDDYKKYNDMKKVADIYRIDTLRVANIIKNWGDFYAD